MQEGALIGVVGCGSVGVGALALLVSCFEVCVSVVLRTRYQGSVHFKCALSRRSLLDVGLSN